MSLGSIVVWIGIYLITFTVFGAAAFGYFAGWWDDACLVAIALMTLVGFLAGRLTKTDYFIRRLTRHLPDTQMGQDNHDRADGQKKRQHANANSNKSRGDVRTGFESGFTGGGIFHDVKHLRRTKNAVYTLTEMDWSSGKCRCWKCGSVNHQLSRYPYDPKFHRSGCPIPGARLLVAPIEIADDVAVK